MSFICKGVVFHESEYGAVPPLNAVTIALPLFAPKQILSVPVIENVGLGYTVTITVSLETQLTLLVVITNELVTGEPDVFNPVNNGEEEAGLFKPVEGVHK